MAITMTNHNSLSAAPDTSVPWHVIREYGSHCSSEELLRNVIRRHLELSQEKSDQILPYSKEAHSL